MSELNERRWAVLSERGREQAGLSYGEATDLVARLRQERVRGICVVTVDAASHVAPAQKAAGKPTEGNREEKAGAPAAKPRRSRKKGAS